jgi:hypothetical protein
MKAGSTTLKLLAQLVASVLLACVVLWTAAAAMCC